MWKIWKYVSLCVSSLCYGTHSAFVVHYILQSRVTNEYSFATMIQILKMGGKAIFCVSLNVLNRVDTMTCVQIVWDAMPESQCKDILPIPLLYITNASRKHKACLLWLSAQSTFSLVETVYNIYTVAFKDKGESVFCVVILLGV